MPVEPEPHTVGRHRLGPHLVGTRVVVRHLLPDGRATDVLGVCLAWEGDHIVVDRDGTGPVRIALADVVTGKPVPPRASVRDRVSARDAELHGVAMFPGLETTPLGEWVLRTDPGPADRLFKRANSCLAMGQPEGAFPDAEAAVRAFYAQRERPALVQVERDSMNEHSFRMAGWQALDHGETDFLIASTASVLRTCNRQLAALDGPASRREVAPAADYTEDEGALLVELRDPHGDLLSRGRAALDGDWLGLHGLATNPAYRRQGLAHTVLSELLDWGAARGATTTWLHVETDNAPARAFHDALGFRAHHGCRYLTK